VRVVREGRTLVADVPVERLLIDADVRSGDQLFVERRGWWSRNSPSVVGALISAVAIVISVSAR
jgi:Tat protein secretion system quality control protein TatD with DNase activity